MLYLHHEHYSSDEVVVLKREFNYHLQYSWLTHPLVQIIIAGLEGNVVHAPNVYESPILGVLGPERLSGGAKCLIWMLNEPQYHFPMRYLGDNCAPYLKMVSDVVDCHLQYEDYIIMFDDEQIVTTPKGTVSQKGMKVIYSLLQEEGST